MDLKQIFNEEIIVAQAENKVLKHIYNNTQNNFKSNKHKNSNQTLKQKKILKTEESTFYNWTINELHFNYSKKSVSNYMDHVKKKPTNAQKHYSYL